MRKPFRLVLLFVFLACGNFHLSAQSLPAPNGFINDFAGVLNEENFNTLEALCTAVKEKTGAEIAVVTVETFTPYATIEEYSLALAEKWGVGEKGKDNGVLFITAMTERKVRIEVGYGLEGIIPDSVAGRILDTAVIPSFREDNFESGIVNGTKTIAGFIAKENEIDLAEFNVELPRQSESEESKATSVVSFLIVLVLCIVFRKQVFPILFFILSSVLSGGGGSGRSGGGFGGGSFGGGGASRSF